MVDAPFGNRSDYLVRRLSETPDYNLFNYVKFHLIDDQLRKRLTQPPRILDVGCGLQVARRYLEALNPGLDYFGVDYEAAFQPDAVVDIVQPNALREPMQWGPNVVMLLDVLEHLHEDVQTLDAVLMHLAQLVPARCVVVITVPQLYRLDRFKLPHLHYPEHKIRLTPHEWHRLIGHYFDIDDTQGLGYISALPYLLMALKSYRPDNHLGRRFRHLREHTFERAMWKPLDLWLSRTLGSWSPCKEWSNDLLFVAYPRESRSP